ncbi:MAG: sulfate ABC transporter substrate-binding protein, partial [Terrimicrobiaceae bacterium]
GARGATTTFVERGLGDVLINWENELLLVKKLRGDEFEVVVPSVSILAEPTVSVVDKIVDKRGTREIATEYLKFLYSDTGQEIAARHFFRPSNKDVLAKHAGQYPKLELFTITDVFGGWTKATKEHFVDGAAFDQVYSGSGEKK